MKLNKIVLWFEQNVLGLPPSIYKDTAADGNG